MNEPGSPGTLTTVVTWEGSRAAVIWVGIFPLHHFWPLLAPFFGDALLPPQRRMEDDGVAWTWRALPGLPTSDEIASLRRRLAGDLEALTDRVNDGAARAELAALASEMQRVVSGWAKLTDADFGRFVARTAAGLRLHSWSATQPPEPRDPSAGGSAVEKSETGERDGAPRGPGHRSRWTALALLALIGFGAWYVLQRSQSEPSEPAGAAPSEATANAAVNEAPNETAAVGPQVRTGSDSGFGAGSVAAGPPQPDRPSTVLSAGAGSTVVSIGGRGRRGASGTNANPSNAGPAGTADGAAPSSTPVMILPQMTLQVGPSTGGPAAPAASGLGAAKGSVPPADSGMGPKSDQSPSAAGGGLPGSKEGGEGDGGPIASAGTDSPHSESGGAKTAAASNPAEAKAAKAAAPSGPGASPSDAPSRPSAKSADSGSAGESPAASQTGDAKAKAETPDAADASPKAAGDVATADADNQKVDTEQGSRRGGAAQSDKRNSQDSDAGGAEAGDGAGSDRPAGPDQAAAAGTPRPRESGARDLSVLNPMTQPVPVPLRTVTLRLAPWRAEMLSDRILPTLPAAAGAETASPAAERDRELSDARARLQALRGNLTLAAAFRVTFTGGQEAWVRWPAPDFERRSDDGALLVRISCAADGSATVSAAPGVAVAVVLTGETKVPAAAEQIFWQARKGDDLPRPWTLAATPTTRTLTIPLMAPAGARAGPDPTDVPLALTDSDSGWSFATQLSAQGSL